MRWNSLKMNSKGGLLWIGYEKGLRGEMGALQLSLLKIAEATDDKLV